ncbi:MAG: zinc/manganese transport system ATP-binding protein [Archaeoglobaceae archaeon]|nr:zinc/manganese transport system ATP-binding protein [Archaeoglobaceae archaeon]MDK2876665.1 zinc/manganese transport system ATP-binding protein [Archaeoglobaceae archaeon]
MAVKAKNLSFSYGKNFALQNLSFEIVRGEFVAVLGPNGAGKTTLLKCILGILKAEGELEVLGCDPRRDRRILKRISYVPQRSSLTLDLPITVEKVLRMYTKELDWEILKELEIEDKMDFLFRELSGGFQQRVLIARALMKKPELLLLDEPFNGVDLVSQEKIVEILESTNITTIMVLHNINPVLHALDRVMLLNKEIIAFGSPKDVFTKENMLKLYKTEIPLIICEEGFIHPLYGDHHG